MSTPLPATDVAWTERYPPWLATAAQFQFSELTVIAAASDWLAAHANLAPRRIVDLGAGAGKFCLAAAERHPHYIWIGIEHRRALVDEAEAWRRQHELSNAAFEVANLTSVELGAFAGGFCFNPFDELLDTKPNFSPVAGTGAVAFRKSLAALRQQLSDAPLGFALATYYLAESALPESYQRVWQGPDKRLLGWIKVACVQPA